jgi:hypothetical protein
MLRRRASLRSYFSWLWWSEDTSRANPAARLLRTLGRITTYPRSSCVNSWTISSTTTGARTSGPCWTARSVKSSTARGCACPSSVISISRALTLPRKGSLRVRGQGAQGAGGSVAPQGSRGPQTLDRRRPRRRDSPEDTPMEALFLNHRAQRLGPRDVRRILDHRVARGHVHPHALRHTYATHLVEGGSGPARGARTLGSRELDHHSDLHPRLEVAPAKSASRHPPAGLGARSAGNI